MRRLYYSYLLLHTHARTHTHTHKKQPPTQKTTARGDPARAHGERGKGDRKREEAMADPGEENRTGRNSRRTEEEEVRSLRHSEGGLRGRKP